MLQHTPTPKRRAARLALALFAVLAAAAALFALAPQGALSRREGQMLYLAPDAAGNRQIMSRSVHGGAPTVLTDEPLGVWDYSLSPDGAAIVYAALRADDGADLVYIDADGRERHVLTDASAFSTSGAVWLPRDDSALRLVYQREPWADGLPSGDPELWLLDPATGATEPLGGDAPRYGSDPRASADGRWVAYVSASGSEIIAWNLRDGRTFTFPEASGLPVSWHPQRNVFLASQTQIVDERVVMGVMLVDPETETVTPLAASDWAEHSVPAWSTDGERIALAAVPLGSAGAIARQLWVTEGVDGAADALTNHGDLRYGAPVWSPDGRYLAYERRPGGDITRPPGLWLLDLTTGEEQELATVGALPVWAR